MGGHRIRRFVRSTVPRARTPSSSPFRGRCLRSRRRGPTGLNSRSPGVSCPHKSCPPPTERSVRSRGCLQADCSCISGGLRPPDTPCFPGRTPSSPGPSGRGTTRFAPYVPLDPLCGPGADRRWFAGFKARCPVPGRLSGLGIDGLGGQRIDGCAPDSSLCSLALTLRTTRSRLLEPESSPCLSENPVTLTVLPLQGEVPAKQAEGAPPA